MATGKGSGLSRVKKKTEVPGHALGYALQYTRLTQMLLLAPEQNQFAVRRAKHFVGKLESALDLHRRIGSDSNLVEEVAHLRKQVQALGAELTEHGRLQLIVLDRASTKVWGDIPAVVGSPEWHNGMKLVPIESARLVHQIGLKPATSSRDILEMNGNTMQVQLSDSPCAIGQARSCYQMSLEMYHEPDRRGEGFTPSRREEPHRQHMRRTPREQADSRACSVG